MCSLSRSNMNCTGKNIITFQTGSLLGTLIDNSYSFIPSARVEIINRGAKYTSILNILFFRIVLREINVVRVK